MLGSGRPSSEREPPASVRKPPAEVLEESKVIEEETTDEFIRDWDMPEKDRYGRFEIRKFKMPPYVTVTFGFE